jgi:hypothetical protein
MAAVEHAFVADKAFFAFNQVFDFVFGLAAKRAVTVFFVHYHFVPYRNFVLRTAARKAAAQSGRV